MQQPYTTPATEAQTEYIEKKSRFIASIAPVSSEAEAIAFVARIRARYPDARHNVYAYRVLENHAVRYSDDGEPQGTAGVPVLDMLQKSGIDNVALVVTRYFGGILLGANGLVRAYTAAAKAALDAAGVKTYRLCTVCEAVCSYPLYQKWIRELPRQEVRITDSVFAELVVLRLSVLKERYDAFCAWARESSAGTVTPVIIEECWEA